MSAIVRTEGLVKRYDGTLAVAGLDLAVEEGEIFGLVGPNGAGKTTTLLMLTTLLKPTSGTARVNGFDLVRQAGQVRRSIGIVFQDPSSDDTLTGYENLKLHGMLYGMPAALREQRIGEVLELVDLTDRKGDIVKHYSGGMRRRLELARGLMYRPKVLFLAERAGAYVTGSVAGRLDYLVAYSSDDVDRAMRWGFGWGQAGLDPRGRRPSPPDDGDRTVLARIGTRSFFESLRRAQDARANWVYVADG